MAELVRLNKYLAHNFGLSRREADLKISEGKVLVNGKPAQLGTIVNPDRDNLSLDSTPLKKAPQRYTYLLMNKPVGYICSRKQQGDTPTIYSLLPRRYHHLKVAGRLDKDSQGLLMLTNDGDTIFKLTHPQFAKQKIYQVGLNKPLKPADKAKIQAGLKLEDGVSKLTISAVPTKAGISKKSSIYKVTMYEGRNRQIRRTFKTLDYTVTHLERIKLGSFTLSELKGKPYLQF